MPGRVSVDRAVAAIRYGLAKGKNHIAFPTGFSGPAAAGQPAIGYPAPAVAQDGALMNIAIIGSGIAGLTCAATGRTPSGNAVRSGRHAGRPHRHRGCRHAAGHGPSIPDLSSTTIAPIRALWACSASWGSPGKNADELLGPQPGQRHGVQRPQPDLALRPAAQSAEAGLLGTAEARSSASTARRNWR